MKKLSFVAIAIALVLGMAQCKKEQTPNSNPNTEPNEKVTITLDVSGGKTGNGTKVDVNTTSGLVGFQLNDTIYVGSNGVYVGTLTYNGSRFVGDLTNPTPNQKLWFYFLGNKTPDVKPIAGTTTRFKVDISDQRTELPVLSMGQSYEDYSESTSNYHAVLQNQCALVEFKLTTGTVGDVVVGGLSYDGASVSFSQPGIRESPVSYNGPDIYQSGHIYLYDDRDDNTNTKKWAIMLPNGSGLTRAHVDGFLPVLAELPQINADAFINNESAIRISNQVAAHRFQVDPNGKKVIFSPGNLQFNVSEGYHRVSTGGGVPGTYRFAPNQWDYVGQDNANISSVYYGWIDLFGWGTSGYMDKFPYMTSENDTDYGDGTNNFTYGIGSYDWGYYNDIQIDNNSADPFWVWRTLTYDEWDYILNIRQTPSGIRYAKATVNNVPGLILLPDDWDDGYYTFIDPNTQYAHYSNNISEIDWTSGLEPAGAVFLPAADTRWNDTNPPLISGDVGGFYWSATSYYTESAYRLHFDGNSHLEVDTEYRNRGCSVRLVQEVK